MPIHIVIADYFRQIQLSGTRSGQNDDATACENLLTRSLCKEIRDPSWSLDAKFRKAVFGCTRRRRDIARVRCGRVMVPIHKKRRGLSQIYRNYLSLQIGFVNAPSPATSQTATRAHFHPGAFTSHAKSLFSNSCVLSSSNRS